MMKEAINRILELALPNVLEINGRQYCDKRMDRIRAELIASPLEVHTLTAVVDYITRGTDDCALLDGCDTQDGDVMARDRRYIIHVASHEHVLLHTELNQDKERECLLDVTVNPISYPFGRWMSVESFIIAMQAHFVPSASVDALVKLVGTVTDENSITLADDGVTQKATARSGVAMEKRVDVPNPIALAPYRTFNEICQPESAFVFRVRKGNDGVEAALFTADGNAWQNDAILAVRQYFEDMIPGELRDEVIILA